MENDFILYKILTSDDVNTFKMFFHDLPEGPKKLQWCSYIDVEVGKNRKPFKNGEPSFT